MHTGWWPLDFLVEGEPRDIGGLRSLESVLSDVEGERRAALRAVILHFSLSGALFLSDCFHLSLTLTSQEPVVNEQTCVF